MPVRTRLQPPQSAGTATTARPKPVGGVHAPPPRSAPAKSTFGSGPRFSEHTATLTATGLFVPSVHIKSRPDAVQRERTTPGVASTIIPPSKASSGLTRHKVLDASQGPRGIARPSATAWSVDSQRSLNESIVRMEARRRERPYSTAGTLAGQPNNEASHVTAQPSVVAPTTVAAAPAAVPRRTHATTVDQPSAPRAAKKRVRIRLEPIVLVSPAAPRCERQTTVSWPVAEDTNAEEVPVTARRLRQLPPPSRRRLHAPPQSAAVGGGVAILTSNPANLTSDPACSSACSHRDSLAGSLRSSLRSCLRSSAQSSIHGCLDGSLCGSSRASLHGSLGEKPTLCAERWRLDPLGPLGSQAQAQAQAWERRRLSELCNAFQQQRTQAKSIRARHREGNAIFAG